jgi:hypothetical protein
MFHKGVSVSSAQSAITRIFERLTLLIDKYEPLTEEQKNLFKEISAPVAGQKLCGALAVGGFCILPEGHNLGRLDIPSNHQAATGCGDTPETDAILQMASIEDRFLLMPELARKLKPQRDEAMREHDAKQQSYEEEVTWLEGLSLELGKTERKLDATRLVLNKSQLRINELEQECRKLRQQLAEK